MTFVIPCAECSYVADGVPDLLDHVSDHYTGETFDVRSASEPGLGFGVGATRLHNVHKLEACEGQPCVVHNPSDHRMREWELHWRGDRGIMERLCPTHGTGHPDPDDMAYRRRAGLDDAAGVHGCCGCCFSR